MTSDKVVKKRKEKKKSCTIEIIFRSLVVVTALKVCHFGVGVGGAVPSLMCPGRKAGAGGGIAEGSCWKSVTA